MDFWILFLTLISILILIYFYIQRKFSFWSKRSIPGPPPSLLSFGNSGYMFARDPFKFEQDFRQKYGKVYGNYRGFQPVLAISDAELVKQIMVKDFHLFVDQQGFTVHHPIASKIVFMQNSPNWKRLRTITTPCFSSAKLKNMFAQMDRSVDQLSGHFEQLIQNENGLIQDVKKVMVGFTLDVIASNVFGVETNSNTDAHGRGLENPFMVNALKLVDISAFKLMGFFALPGWALKWFGLVQPFNDQSWDFFEKLAREILRQRRANREVGAKRNDLIEILINAQVDESKLDSSYEKLDGNFDDHDRENEEDKVPIGTSKSLTLTENEIMAQAIGFMVGGYDSVAIALSFGLYELAINPEVQERLFDELEQELSNKKPNSTEYNETVMQLPYLDSVIKESLRKYPPFTRVGRTFGGSPKPYKLGSTGLVLQKGQLVEFPTLSIHYNAEYFPEPNRFNPDRFMSENKDKLVPYSFNPFAQGPRNCIGLRFANQEMKLCLAKICRQFRFVPSQNTPPSPIAFLPYKPTIVTAPIEIRVERRL